MDLSDQRALTARDASSGVSAQAIEVSRDNVVELGVLFAAVAARLEREVRELRGDLRLDRPWLGDPVSAWIWELFNRFFVEDEHSFAAVVQRTYEQHLAHARALIEAAKQYGLADELNAEIYRRLGAGR
jgi:hypothetical protein